MIVNYDSRLGVINDQSKAQVPESEGFITQRERTVNYHMAHK